MLRDYLSNRKQRIKVENVFSKWENNETGVPQGSAFGPLFFNIFVCDLLLILGNTYFSSCTDDNTPYTINHYQTYTHTSYTIKLSILLLSWFKESKLQLNLEKCRLMLVMLISVPVSCTEIARIKLDDLTITNSKM